VELFIDGTFKCVPKPFSQLLIVMVRDAALDHYIPVFYVLVQRKTQWTYWNALNEIIVSLGGKISVSQVHCDFEKGLINAIREIFPEARVVGCLFHWKQALLRKMKVNFFKFCYYYYFLLLLSLFFFLSNHMSILILLLGFTNTFVGKKTSPCFGMH
jgi:hypothetical protein